MSETERAIGVFDSGVGGISTLAALARALRCTVDDLIEETDGRENDGKIPG